MGAINFNNTHVTLKNINVKNIDTEVQLIFLIRDLI